MALTRRVAATTAIATLIVPFAAMTAHAAAPSDAWASPETVSLVVPPQTYVVASAAQTQPTVRDGYESVYTPPPVVEPDTGSDPSPASVDSPDFAPPSQDYSGANIVAYAEQFVGVVPYGTGNNPADSFSCDGLVQYVFGQFGIGLPRGADNQAALATIISPSEAQAGDLLWWPGQHIGIYDGAGGMIDSPDWRRYVEHRGIWGSPVYIRL
ncbi:hypothetical protein GCM10025768_16880 [Microbacterium pseudoresistens]|uniref:Cell wall-associated NlpC family hydrolase n=1 Tax=Microbacterium pseudoresistens TaxID=640634 RepID=A0A7Y9JMU9_9MICO|nr:NlpC/P60 family protein [Microbacterium pseudoresistens]NYD52959.1 cell wall-associated NlpC family hydrolase [Microbacterium pseudoresistens]